AAVGLLLQRQRLRRAAQEQLIAAPDLKAPGLGLNMQGDFALLNPPAGIGCFQLKFADRLVAGQQHIAQSLGTGTELFVIEPSKRHTAETKNTRRMSFDAQRKIGFDKSEI